jgi:predicted nucleic-acid-binding Zn-ribbon protein
MEPGEAADRGAITPQEAEQRERALAWLDIHWKGSRKCPICASNSWGIGGIAELLPFFPNTQNLTIPIGVQPMFTVTCKTCGYTFMMNALISGVVAPYKEHDE